MRMHDKLLGRGKRCQVRRQKHNCVSSLLMSGQSSNNDLIEAPKQPAQLDSVQPRFATLGSEAHVITLMLE